LDEPAFPLDAETKAREMPEHHREELRLWLRLLTCTTLIEGEVRRRLRSEFGVTLPRFDLMAQLDRVPGGMTLSDLSRRMMVTNGNVTGLVDRLVEQGLVARRVSQKDRRSQLVSLTAAGRADFRAMADAHERWIDEMLGGVSRGDSAELMRLLGKAKASVRRAVGGREHG
jgi:DNA-binding MarR family transcriptional regulator